MCHMLFRYGEDAFRAMDSLNGLEIAGRYLKVAPATDRNATQQGGPTLDREDIDRRGAFSLILTLAFSFSYFAAKLSDYCSF